MKISFTLLVVAVALFIGFCPIALNAADKTLGALFIKTADATVDGQQFTDPELADSVKDMKARSGKFVIVDDESRADFLIVVLERKTEQRSSMGRPENHRMISATFSIKDGGSWKPACKLGSESGWLGKGATSWGLAARGVMNEAQKCAAANMGK
jgi:hypothetical protein